MPARNPGPTFTELQQQQLERQTLTIRCQQPGCRFKRTASFLDARAAFSAHMTEHHPDVAARLAKKRASRSVPAVEKRKQSGVCHRDGCGKPQAGPTRGPHAYLCAECIAEQRLSRAAALRKTPPSRDEMLDALRRFHAENGRAPSQQDLRLVEWLPAPSRVNKEFGGLIAALDAAGVPRPALFAEVVPAAPPSAAHPTRPTGDGDERPSGAGPRDGGGDDDPWAELREAWGWAA